MPRRITAGPLTRLATALLERAGVEPPNAALCARHLVDANLMGHDSHGVAMLTVYLRWIARGGLLPNAHARVVHDRVAVAVLDGGFGLGQVVGKEAMDLAIVRARAAGIACVALRNAGHLGRIGAYGEMCAEAGLVSMHYANVVGLEPMVVPFGGREPRLFTNPYCGVVPRPDGRHIVVDFATSAVALGKAHAAWRRGEALDSGMAVDATGEPTTDPAALFGDGPRGHLLPFGQHKGGGLQVLCELLGGALAGHWTIQSEPRRDHGATLNHMLSIVLDPEAFGGRDDFEREATVLVEALRRTPPGPGVEALLLPGDPERAAAAKRTRDGLDLDDRTWAGLAKAAAGFGLDAETLVASA